MIRRASRSAPFLACSLMSRTSAAACVLRLVLHPLEDLAARVLGREPGDPLQLDPLLLGQAVGLALACAERVLPLGQRLLALPEAALPALDLLQLPILSPAPLLGPTLESLPLLAAALDLAVQVLAQLEGLHLGGDQDLRLGGFSLAHGIGAEPVGFGAGSREDARRRRGAGPGRSTSTNTNATTSPAATPARTGRSRD